MRDSDAMYINTSADRTQVTHLLYNTPQFTKVFLYLNTLQLTKCFGLKHSQHLRMCSKNSTSSPDVRPPNGPRTYIYVYVFPHFVLVSYGGPHHWPPHQVPPRGPPHHVPQHVRARSARRRRARPRRTHPRRTGPSRANRRRPSNTCHCCGAIID